MYYEREGLNAILHWQKYDQTYAQKGPNEQHRPLYLQIEGNPGSTLRITDLYEYNIPKTHIKKKKRFDYKVKSRNHVHATYTRVLST